MPETKVYLCDKIEVDNFGRPCPKQVRLNGTLAEGAVVLNMTVTGRHNGTVDAAELPTKTFCGPKHLEFWLRRALKTGFTNPAAVTPDDDLPADEEFHRAPEPEEPD